MNWSVYLLLQKPAYQALLFLLLTILLILVIQPKSTDKAWTIAIYIFVLFLIVNTVLLWFDDHPWRYFFYSLGFAVVYTLFIAIIVPALVGVLKLKGSGESAMAFLILIYHPFALLLVMLAKYVANRWL